MVLALVLVRLSDRDRYLESAGDAVVWDVLAREVTRVDLPDGVLEVGPPPRVQRDGDVVPADPEAVRRLLDALEEARRGLPVDGPATLAGARRAITVWRGGRADRIEVGEAAPVGDRTYVVTGDGRLVAVRGALGRQVAAGAGGLLGDGT
ncbi:MAG: hypothetical protein H6732_15535 [Alphaproteobacteria bacterium]|nr:hypothetical protein [Alphaproteobacteria bacterium]